MAPQASNPQPASRRARAPLSRPERAPRCPAHRGDQRRGGAVTALQWRGAGRAIGCSSVDARSTVGRAALWLLQLLHQLRAQRWVRAPIYSIERDHGTQVFAFNAWFILLGDFFDACSAPAAAVRLAAAERRLRRFLATRSCYAFLLRVRRVLATTPGSFSTSAPIRGSKTPARLRTAPASGGSMSGTSAVFISLGQGESRPCMHGLPVPSEHLCTEVYSPLLSTIDPPSERRAEALRAESFSLCVV